MSTELDQMFTYEYSFDFDGETVLVHVSHGFENIADLESISTFPHQQRRNFARELLAKYGPHFYHQVETSDITCPFAIAVAQLFQNELKVYWAKRNGLTLLFLTGRLFY